MLIRFLAWLMRKRRDLHVTKLQLERWWLSPAVDMLIILVIIVIILLAAGCADARYYWLARAEHQSSLSQHFEVPAHSFGWDIVSTGFAATKGHWRFEITDGWAVDHAPFPQCSREIFNASATYQLPLN